MISHRKEKKLLARGLRIQKCAQRHFENWNIPTNDTSRQLADLYSRYECQAIDQDLLAVAIG